MLQIDQEVDSLPGPEMLKNNSVQLNRPSGPSLIDNEDPLEFALQHYEDSPDEKSTP